MKILLIGEYSNAHNNLAKGLRELGHKVTVVNDGDHWKHFNSDINLSRKIYAEKDFLHKVLNFYHLLIFLIRLILALPQMRGYDIVQLINPVYLPLKPKRLLLLYHYLRKHNKRMILGGMGDDYYYCYINRTLKPMRYSDYNIGTEEHITSVAQWTYHDKVCTKKGLLCRYIAADCDAIIAGAYEYWLPYHLTEDRSNDGTPIRVKLHHIAFPIDLKGIKQNERTESLYPIRVFIGISKGRSEFKGTDVMLKAAQDLQKKYPNKLELKIAEGVPFAQYQRMMDTSDVLLDQLYSYGPGMNALLGLAKGMVTLSGGEPEHYDILGETECRPIINVTPSYNDVYTKLENIILHPEKLSEQKAESRRYVERNHDYIAVAGKYEDVYKKLLDK